MIRTQSRVRVWVRVRVIYLNQIGIRHQILGGVGVRVMHSRSDALSSNLTRIDKIPIHVIKDCLPAILPSLTSIINATFEFDTFPLAWKTAEVTPILKAGDHDIPNNNRPISLLPVLS